MDNIINFPLGRKPKPKKKLSLMEQMELEAWQKKQARRAEIAKHNDETCIRLKIGKYDPRKIKNENNPGWII